MAGALKCFRCIRCACECTEGPSCWKEVRVIDVIGRTAITEGGPVELGANNHVRPGMFVLTCSGVSVGSTNQHRALPTPRGGGPLVPPPPGFDSPQWRTGADALGKFLPLASDPPSQQTVMIQDAAVLQNPALGFAALDHQAGYGTLMAATPVRRVVTPGGPAAPINTQVSISTLETFFGQLSPAVLINQPLAALPYKDNNTTFQFTSVNGVGFSRSTNWSSTMTLGSALQTSGQSEYPPDVRTFQTPVGTREVGFSQRYAPTGPYFTPGENVTLRLKTISPPDQVEYDFTAPRLRWDGAAQAGLVRGSTDATDEYPASFTVTLSAEIAGLGERTLLSYRLREVWWWAGNGYAHQLILEGRYLSDSEAGVGSGSLTARRKLPGDPTGSDDAFLGIFIEQPDPGNWQATWVTVATMQTHFSPAPAGAPLSLPAALAPYGAGRSGVGDMIQTIEALGVGPALASDVQAYLSNLAPVFSTWLNDLETFRQAERNSATADLDAFISMFNGQTTAQQRYLMSRTNPQQYLYERSWPVTRLGMSWIVPTLILTPPVAGPGVRWRSPDGLITVSGPANADHADLTGSTLSVRGSEQGGSWAAIRDAPYLLEKVWKFDRTIILFENGGDVTAVRSTGTQTLSRAQFETDVLRVEPGRFRRFLTPGLGSHSWPPQRCDVLLEDVLVADVAQRTVSACLTAFDPWRDCIKSTAPPDQPAHWYWPGRPSKRPTTPLPSAPTAPLGLTLAELAASGDVLVRKGKSPLLLPVGLPLLRKPMAYSPAEQLEALDDSTKMVTTLSLTFVTG